MADSTKTGVEEGVGYGSSETSYTNYCQINKHSGSVDRKSINYGGDSKDDDCGHAYSEVKEEGRLHKVFKSRGCKYADVIITVLIIGLMWMLMALPTVIYIDKKVLQRSAQKGNGASNSLTNNVTGSDSDCRITSIQQYKNCLRDSNIPQTSICEPTLISDTNQYVALKSRYPQCLLKLEPLVICLQFIPPLDEETPMVQIVQNMTQCDHVLNVCDKDLKKWNSQSLAEKYMFYCAPNNPHDDKYCRNTSNPNISVQQVYCSKGFFYSVQKTGCKPECGVWTPHSERELLISKILIVFSSVFCAVAGFAVLLISWARCQKLCRYPSIFVVYQTVPTIVLAILALTGVSAGKKLFCRSKDFFGSFFNPTPFCTVSGIVVYYILIHLMLWWLCHIIAVFWTVNWSSHSKKIITSKKNNRYLHIVSILACIILPTIPVLIVVFVSSQPWIRHAKGFTMTSFPPLICTGFDTDVNFWAALFPVCLVLVTGTTLLVLILRVVIKNHLLSKIYNIRITSGWIIELKVLLVLCYYVIIGAAVVTVFTYDLFIVNDPETFMKYFCCEFGGLVPNSNKSRCTDLEKSLHHSMNPFSTGCAIVFLGFLPVVNLVYVVKLSDLKSKMKTYSQTRYIQYIQKGATRAGRHLFSDHKRTTLSHVPVTNNINSEPLITPHAEYDSHC